MFLKSSKPLMLGSLKISCGRTSLCFLQILTKSQNLTQQQVDALLFWISALCLEAEQRQIFLRDICVSKFINKSLGKVLGVGHFFLLHYPGIILGSSVSFDWRELTILLELSDMTTRKKAGSKSMRLRTHFVLISNDEKACESKDR